MGLTSLCPKVYIICGSTSTGKTLLALELCKKLSGEIISADSRQVYKFMDIGTGKLPVCVPGNKVRISRHRGYWKVGDVYIWGYDLVAPSEYFSGFDYAVFALSKTRELLDQGKKVFIVGGTGFYIDLLTGRAKPSFVKPDFELRQTLEKMPLGELHQLLMSLNLSMYEKIDKDNKVRLIRAVEREEASKKLTSPPPLPSQELPYLQNVKYVYVGLTAPRGVLYGRADAWLDTVWQGGLLDEVRSLNIKGFGSSPAAHGLIYNTAGDFLAGRSSETDARQKAKFDLHAYIRRQQAWFKRNSSIFWFDITDPSFKEVVYNYVDG